MAPYYHEGNYALPEVMRFNEAIMLTANYDPNPERPMQTGLWQRDLYGHFFQGKELKQQENIISFSTQHAGIEQTPLLIHNRMQFAKAAVGDGFLVSRVNRYIHQNIEARYL
jgi:hypothetical protein